MSLAVESDGRVARHSSEHAEHFTPPSYVEAARKALGGIDLDPATCLLANEYIRAKRIYTAEDNGFLKPWKARRVFLNPPGGKCDDEGRHVHKIPKEKGGGYAYDDTGRRCERPTFSSAKLWWRKLVWNVRQERVELAVFVGFSLEILQTTQVSTAKIITAAEEGLPTDYPICYPARRVAYMVADRRGAIAKSTSPPHGSFFVGLCKPGMGIPLEFVPRFRAAFEGFGAVVVPEGFR